MDDLFAPTHLILIAVIALLIFGPRKLPEIGAGLGRAIREFKESFAGISGVPEEIRASVRTAGNPAGPAAQSGAPAEPAPPAAQSGAPTAASSAAIRSGALSDPASAAVQSGPQGEPAAAAPPAQSPAPGPEGPHAYNGRDGTTPPAA